MQRQATVLQLYMIILNGSHNVRYFTDFNGTSEQPVMVVVYGKFCPAQVPM